MADLRSELMDIYERRGVLTPQLVVEEASDEDSVLHGHFEWDDEIAAHAHRLDQARRLMRRVKVIYIEATETTPAQRIRAFHALPEDTGFVWRPIEDVSRDPVAMEILLRDAARQWQALRRRFEHLSEFWAIVQQDLPGEEGTG